MSDLSDIDDATFQLATGEELVLPGDLDALPESGAPGGPANGAPALTPVGPRPVARPSFLDRRTAGRLRARKVRRLVRHVEPWSVLKVALIFYFCLWVILLIAGVILWSLAVSSGMVDNVETFVTELFALESFTFNADQIFRASAIGGLVLVVAGAGFTVLMAVLFNLISDLTGGVRFTVVEEETARPRPKRLRPRRSMMSRITGTPGPVTVSPAPVPGPAQIPMPEPSLATMEEPSGDAGPAYETNVMGDDVPVINDDVPVLATAESAGIEAAFDEFAPVDDDRPLAPGPESDSDLGDEGANEVANTEDDR